MMAIPLFLHYALHCPILCPTDVGQQEAPRRSVEVGQATVADVSDMIIGQRDGVPLSGWLYTPPGATGPDALSVCEWSELCPIEPKAKPPATPIRPAASPAQIPSTPKCST